MKSDISKTCSRCKKEIQCRPESIENCHCAKITISDECREYLVDTNYDCLCNSCLLYLDQLVHKAYNSSAKLTEGIHYVLEGGLMVFTELNHIQRGYCCKSNCRNCAYGFDLE